MFIHRMTWNVKGNMNDAAALMKDDFLKQAAPPHAVRT